MWGFDDAELCTEFALKFSKQNNIVLSDQWANLIEENGINGGDTRKLNEKRIPWNHGKKNCYSQTELSNQKRLILFIVAVMLLLTLGYVLNGNLAVK